MTDDIKTLIADFTESDFVHARGKGAEKFKDKSQDFMMDVYAEGLRKFPGSIIIMREALRMSAYTAIPYEKAEIYRAMMVSHYLDGRDMPLETDENFLRFALESRKIKTDPAVTQRVLEYGLGKFPDSQQLMVSLAIAHLHCLIKNADPGNESFHVRETQKLFEQAYAHVLKNGDDERHSNKLNVLDAWITFARITKQFETAENLSVGAFDLYDAPDEHTVIAMGEIYEALSTDENLPEGERQENSLRALACFGRAMELAGIACRYDVKDKKIAFEKATGTPYTAQIWQDVMEPRINVIRARVNTASGVSPTSAALDNRAPKGP